MKYLIFLYFLCFSQSSYSFDSDERREDYQNTILITGQLKHASFSPLIGKSGEKTYFSKVIFKSKDRIYYLYSTTETNKITPLTSQLLNYKVNDHYTLAMKCRGPAKVIRREKRAAQYFIALGNHADETNCYTIKTIHHGEDK